MFYSTLGLDPNLTTEYLLYCETQMKMDCHAWFVYRSTKMRITFYAFDRIMNMHDHVHEEYTYQYGCQNDRFYKNYATIHMVKTSYHLYLRQGRHFNFFLGGQIFFLFFNATGLVKNWKKQHFICGNLTLFIVPFFLSFFFFLFFLFFLFFFLFLFFSFSLGGGRRPPSNDAPDLRTKQKVHSSRADQQTDTASMKFEIKIQLSCWVYVYSACVFFCQTRKCIGLNHIQCYDTEW